MNLTQFFHGHTGRAINKWMHYLPIYERHFERFCGKPMLFIEIGSGQGGSSQMWKQYFGPMARIVTVDIRPNCKAYEDEQVSVRIGDQSDPEFLTRLVEEFGAPDIVLDDGSHIMQHVCASFRHLYPQLNRDAVYAVEDLHTAYWPAAGGGLQRSGSFMEEMKGLVDKINALNPHHRGQQAETATPDTISLLTRSLHFYESLVVIEKGPFVSKAERISPVGSSALTA